MASIRRRNGRYHVQIRKNGYPSVTKTFIHLKTAKKWASGVEADMERHRYCPIPETIVVHDYSEDSNFLIFNLANGTNFPFGYSSK